MSEPNDSKWSTLRCWWGLTFRNWIRLLAMGPHLDRTSIPHLLALTCTSAANSFLGLLESLLYHRRVARTSLHASPIFILGHWRSGTTLLHNLLALDSQFAFPNLYEVLFPHHFLLSEKRLTAFMANWLPPQRPMDNMPCSWELPEEDETAMLLLTLHSPYLSVAFPSDRQKANRFANLRRAITDRELRTWKQEFLHFLRKVSFKKGSGRLILKSPTHTVRIPVLRQLFPQAYYIHLVRNPFEVFASTVRLRQAMAKINGLSAKMPANLEEEVLDDYMHMYHAYHLHRALVDKDHLCEVRYEDLVADPVDNLQKIYEHFKLSDFEELRPRIEARLESHRIYQTLTTPLSLDMQERVYARWKPAFKRYGYAGPRGLEA